MSWLSSAWNSVSGAVKSVSKAVGKVATVGLSVVKKIATPALSFAASLVPGVGPLLSKGVDILGGALLGDAEDPTSDAGQIEEAPVMQYVAANEGQAVGLGSSPAAMAMASATSQAAETSARGFAGIGDGKPGVFGIGDGQPGVFGIGTGKNKVRKMAEDAAKGEGLSPKAVKLAGDEAVAKIPDKLSEKAADKSTSGAGMALPIIGGILALLLL